MTENSSNSSENIDLGERTLTREKLVGCFWASNKYKGFWKHTVPSLLT